MARTLVGASSEKIDLSLGAGASVTGALTLAMIVKRSVDAASQAVVVLGNTLTTQRSLNIGSSNKPFLRSNNTTNAGTSTITIVAANGWVFFAVTKAAGTATPRYHKYAYSTATWTHENGITTQGDSTPSGASALGYRADSASSFYSGDLAAAGAWTTAMTDTQVEGLPLSFQQWFSYSPNGLWLLDQAATTTKVLDLTGKGANESGITGTAVATSSVPVFNRGTPVIA